MTNVEYTLTGIREGVKIQGIPSSDGGVAIPKGTYTSVFNPEGGFHITSADGEREYVMYVNKTTGKTDIAPLKQK